MKEQALTAEDISKLLSDFKQLNGLFRENPQLIRDVVNSQAVIPLIELLQKKDVEIVKAVTETIELILKNDTNAEYLQVNLSFFLSFFVCFFCLLLFDYFFVILFALFVCTKKNYVFFCLILF